MDKVFLALDNDVEFFGENRSDSALKAGVEILEGGRSSSIKRTFSMII